VSVLQQACAWLRPNQRPVYSRLSKGGILQKATELVFAANLYLLIIT
jgi:hypothetical protein